MASAQEHIRQGRWQAALDTLDTLLDDTPDSIEALYMSAVCHRLRGAPAAALATLKRLKALAPEHGRAHQEEGHTYRDCGQPEQALAAYARATRFNPALVAAWREQHALFQELGQQQAAANAATQLHYVQSLPKPLLAVLDLVGQGKLLRAEDLCREFLKKVPQHVEGMRLLADIGVRLGVLDDAEFLLQAALKLAPTHVPCRMDLIQVLRKRQRFPAALEQARILRDSAPDNPQFQSVFAVECMQSGDFDLALATFDQILRQVPGDPITLTSKGHALKTSGAYAPAVAAYQDVTRLHPQHGEAWYSLANLKVYEFTDVEVETMQSLAATDLLHQDQIYLQFALGKAYEDRSEFAQSFEHYALGNQLKKQASRYDPNSIAADMQAVQAATTASLFERHADSGCVAPDPIFIVGLPRAGSTLLEQILSSHSQVDGTLELPNVLSLVQRLRRKQPQHADERYPALLSSLTPEELTAFGDAYLRDTAVHRQSAPFFVDKMPNNFRHLGLIKLMLPNAKIIDARRHPMTCCFSAFRQLFAEGQEFTYDLGDCGSYYRDYVSLMDHWDRVLPGFVLRVNYEEVVADLEREVRRLLDFCGLPFEPACLEFHRTVRNVRTPSSEQVRRPIFASALESWRQYEPWLKPLKQSLGEDLLEQYGIDLPSSALGGSGSD
ncbi:MAG: sulfotransferase [Pseudomonadota bacterium]